MILCGFAVLVGTLTTRRLDSDFERNVAQAAEELQRQLRPTYDVSSGNRRLYCDATSPCDVSNLAAYTSTQPGAVIRVVDERGRNIVETSVQTPFLGPPRPEPAEVGDYRVEARPLAVAGVVPGAIWVQYGARRSAVEALAARIRVVLGLGVLGGAALALLAGLATARRAMQPVATLTEAARTIRRTRDPSMRLPAPEADDEVAELQRTLEQMLRALDEAREETDTALARQREFVADASHELRTPLTGVLANLELLEAELDGEPRDTASSALRSTRRMRRLVADLLLLARADAQRTVQRAPVDLAAVTADVAAELGPVARDHPLTVDVPEPVMVMGVRDELHRLVLNLIDNALKHTAPKTAVEVAVAADDGMAVLTVTDHGPGVPVEMRDRIFDRFVRGSSDRGGSSGLGLSIVRAVAATHGGTVTLAPNAPDYGARFVVRLPLQTQNP